MFYTPSYIIENEVSHLQTNPSIIPCASPSHGIHIQLPTPILNNRVNPIHFRVLHASHDLPIHEPRSKYMIGLQDNSGRRPGQCGAGVEQLLPEGI